LYKFLQTRGVGEEHREEIVAEIFAACDKDNSGTIEINEFVDHFLKVKEELELKKNRLKTTYCWKTALLKLLTYKN
jgi:EF hand